MIRLDKIQIVLPKLSLLKTENCPNLPTDCLVLITEQQKVALNMWPQKTRDHHIFHSAHKQSLGQGNVFTYVCHSVHRGSGSVSGSLPGREPLDRDPPG